MQQRSNDNFLKSKPQVNADDTTQIEAADLALLEAWRPCFSFARLDCPVVGRPGRWPVYSGSIAQHAAAARAANPVKAAAPSISAFFQDIDDDCTLYFVA